MRKSREYRTWAWTKLGENGGWTAAVVAGLVAWFVPMIVNRTLQQVSGLSNLQQILISLQSGETTIEQLYGNDPAAFVSQLSSYALWFSFTMLVMYYLQAVFGFGLASLSIAVMRGGAKVRHVFTGFGRGWRLLWMEALAQFYVACWALLFIVPGILAALSYELRYFIRVDHPDWSGDRCITESKRLMKGNRWRYFKLCLSFLGWWLLSAATFGLALVFVIPYFNTAKAAFYEDLLDTADQERTM